MFSGVRADGDLEVKNEPEWRNIRFSAQYILKRPEPSSLFHIPVDALGSGFGASLPPTSLYLLLLLSLQQELHPPANGVYSLLLSISHLLLSISTTVQKQFYYVMLSFYSQLK